MNSESMLRELDEAGKQSGADYHDGLNGWLGWSVQFPDAPAKQNRGILTMTFTTFGGNEMFVRRFAMEPM